MRSAIIFCGILVVTAVVASAMASALPVGVVQTKIRLNFNIGTSGDTIYIGDNVSPSTSTWYPNNLTKRYFCATNGTASSTNVSLVMASGGGFRNLNYTSGSTHFAELTQSYGNPYYIFFADTNCTPAQKNAPAIEKGFIGLLGSDPDVHVTSTLAWISYPSINITEHLEMPRGVWDIIVENNGTRKNITSVRVRRA